MEMKDGVVVLVSADVEWQALRAAVAGPCTGRTPYGEYRELHESVCGQSIPVVYVQGGWGKIAAAASTQYAIERWAPVLLMNIGTCGGIRGQIEIGETVLAERTVVYDIIEQMGDPHAAIAHYTTDIDLSWVPQPYPHPVRRTVLMSADRDGLAEQAAALQAAYGASALDWESGSIAWVAARHRKRCLILRRVTDLVDATGNDVYDGTGAAYAARVPMAMEALVNGAGDWIRCAMEASGCGAAAR